MKMPNQARYFKFVMLAILLLLSVLFIAIEILGFKNDIMVKILLQIKCLCSKYLPFEIMFFDLYGLFIFIIPDYMGLSHPLLCI